VLQRLRGRHRTVETQAIDDDGAGYPATLCDAHSWPVGWPCPEVVAIDEELARSVPQSEPPQLRTFAEWVRDVDPTTTTWPRAKQWAVLALAGVDSVGQLFDPSDDPDDDA
jgi:hypothetical protein